MSLSSKLLKGSAIVSASEAVSQICGLIRNIILARVLTKADFGIAATLGMIVSLMEIGGRLSIEHLVVQSSEGDEPRFLGAAHFVQVLLGIISGLLIYFAAGPFANLFGIPNAKWALQLIALIPIIRACAHLDVWRMMRHFRYRPNATIEVASQIVITLMVWPLLKIWSSYAVILWLMLARQLVSTLASHFVAETPYLWRFDRNHIISIFKFGWPLLVGGFTVFAIMQGDRMVIGTWYSMAELGTYAAAATLTTVPAFTLMKVGGFILLPVMAEAKNSEINFRSKLGWIVQTTALLSAMYAGVMIVAGGSMIEMIFGPKYSNAGHLAAWLAIAQTFRLLRNITTVPSMAKGDTSNIMVSNFLRFLGVLASIPLAVFGMPLYVIAAAGASGEIIAFVGSLLRICKREGISIKEFTSPLLPAFLSISIAAMIASMEIHRIGSVRCITVGLLLSGSVLGLYLALFPSLRRKAIEHLPSKFKEMIGITRVAPVR